MDTIRKDYFRLAEIVRQDEKVNEINQLYC